MTSDNLVEDARRDNADLREKAERVVAASEPETRADVDGGG